MSSESMSPIKILHLERSDSDVKEITDLLKKHSVSFIHHQIKNQNDFEEGFIGFSPDLILADFLLFSLISKKIFSFINAKENFIPVILTSSSYSKELASEMAKSGATDFIFKDQLERIAIAVLNSAHGLKHKIEADNPSTTNLIDEIRFQALIDNSSDIILMLNPHGDIIYQNYSADKVFGPNNSGNKRTSLFEYIHPSDMEDGTNCFKQAMLQSGISIPVSFRILAKQGPTLLLEGSMTNFLQNEELKALVVNFKDITEKKSAEDILQKSEANLRTIFDNANVSYLLSDHKFRLISFNASAAKTYAKEFRVQLKEGDYILDYLPEDRKRQSKQRFERALRGEKVNYELSFEQDDRKTTWYTVNMFVARDDSNNPLGLIISSENITDRKNIEFERNKMLADIVQHNKNLEQFAYIISHNLRSPVANILGLSALLENSSEMDTETYTKCMNGLKLSVQKLDEVIVDLNYILQTRRGVNEKKELVNFSELVNDIKTSISAELAKESVVIYTNFETNNFLTLKSYIYSVFFNLIYNSIKYRNPAVPTAIHIQSKTINHKLVIEFRDNGLGIDLAAHGNNIFGLYKKFHKHIEGKGMGLYMVKTQVEILGGKISIASEVNIGTTFTIEFEEHSVSY